MPRWPTGPARSCGRRKECDAAMEYRGAQGLTARLGRIVADETATMSDAWRDLAERAFVDTVGVLFAGHQTTAVTLVTETVLADLPECGGSRSVACGRRMPARGAGLID